MKTIFAFVFVIVASCNTGRHMENYTALKNREHIFANTKRMECKINIEKRIGRQLSVQ